MKLAVIVPRLAVSAVFMSLPDPIALAVDWVR